MASKNLAAVMAAKNPTFSKAKEFKKTRGIN